RASRRRAHLEVLENGQRGEELSSLRHEDDTELCLLVRAEPRDRYVVEADAALPAREESHHRAKERRLAGAVRAEKRRELALAQRDARAPADLDLAVSGLDVLDDERAHRRLAPIRLRLPILLPCPLRAASDLRRTPLYLSDL